MFRRLIVVMLACACAMALLPAAASAHGLKAQANEAWFDAYRAKRDGKIGQRPGRNIARDGVRVSKHRTRSARRHELLEFKGNLERFIAPPPPSPAPSEGQTDVGASTGPSPSASPTGPSASGIPSAIAACESGGDPGAVSEGGTYRGKWQFSRSTWASVGGSGDPAAASEQEQDARAAQLYAQQGSSPWPTCGR